MARPKEFNPDEALEQAMHVFWHRGYEATSMEDLLAAMNLNRGSLYDTFGSKRELFLKAMDRYCAGGGVGSRISILNEPGPALPLIRRFINAMLEFGLSDPLRRGCLIANAAMELAPREKDIAKKVSGRLQMVEEAFFKLLTRAKREGELANDKDPRALARMLVTMMQGTIVMIKAGTPADAVKQTAHTALSILD
jgi:TetR/AcrR family transcriptional regulator, transcriptional repressor for nem operon